MTYILSPKLQYFLNIFSIAYLSITQAKQIINLLLLNNFYPTIYRRVIVYDLVRRYGPQSVASASAIFLLIPTGTVGIPAQTPICRNFVKR